MESKITSNAMPLSNSGIYAVYPNVLDIEDIIPDVTRRSRQYVAQMFYCDDAARLRDFCERAMKENTVYVKVRRNLHSEFIALVTSQTTPIKIENADFNAIKSYLMSKQQPDDNKQLAFMTTVQKYYDIASSFTGKELRIEKEKEQYVAQMTTHKYAEQMHEFREQDNRRAYWSFVSRYDQIHIKNLRNDGKKYIKYYLKDYDYMPIRNNLPSSKIEVVKRPQNYVGQMRDAVQTTPVYKPLLDAQEREDIRRFSFRYLVDFVNFKYLNIVDHFVHDYNYYQLLFQRARDRSDPFSANAELAYYFTYSLTHMIDLSFTPFAAYRDACYIVRSELRVTETEQNFLEKLEVSKFIDDCSQYIFEDLSKKLVWPDYAIAARSDTKKYVAQMNTIKNKIKDIVTDEIKKDGIKVDLTVDATPKVENLVEKSVKTLETASNTAAKIDTHLESITTQISSFKESIVSKLSGICSFGVSGSGNTLLELFGFIVGVTAMIAAFVTAEKVITKGMIAIAFVGITGIGTTLLNVLVEFVGKYASRIGGKTTKYVAHADEEVEEHLFCGVVDIFKHMFVPSSKAEKKIDLERIKNIKAYAGAVKTAKDLIKFLIDLFKSAMETVYEWAVGVPYDATEEYKIWYNDFAAWLVKVQDMFKIEKGEGLKIAIYRQKIATAFITGQELQKRMTAFKTTGNAVNVFTRTFDAVTTLYRDYLKYQREDHGRHRPVTIHLFGAPNAGKSNFANWLIHDLMYIFGVNGNMMPKYDYRVENDFHDGYYGQFATVMDDVLQSNSMDDRRKEVRALISMANDATYNMHMAAMSEKGSVFFDSPIIIMTSNDNSAELLGIQDKGAYKRRRDFVLEVKVKEQYGKLVEAGDGKTKVYELKDGLTFTKDIWEVDVRDRITDKVERANVPFDNILISIADLLKKRQNPDAKLEDFLKKQEPSAFLKELRTKYVAQMMETPLKKLAKVMNEKADKNLDLIVDSITPATDGEKMRQVELSTAYKFYGANDTAETTEGVTTATDFVRKCLAKTKAFFSKIQHDIDDVIFSAYRLQHSGGPPVHSLLKVGLICLTLLVAFSGMYALYEGFTKPRLQWLDKPEIPIVDKTGAVLSTMKNPLFPNKEAEHFAQAGFGTYNRIIQGQPLQQIPFQPQTFTDAPLVGHMADSSALDLVDSCLSKNLCDIWVNNYRTGATFVKGRVIVAAAHSFRAAKFPDCTFRMLWKGIMYELDPKKCRIKYSAQQDQAFVLIDDKALPEAKDITGHFVQGAKLKLVETGKAALVVKTPANLQIRVSNVSPKISDKAIHYPSSEQGGFMCVNTRSIQVQIMTQGGECGFPYIADNTALNKKILGIHVAGADDGICSIITQEDIESALRSFTVGQMSIDVLPFTNPAFNPQRIAFGNVKLIGQMPKELSIRLPNKSKYCESPFYNRWHTSKHGLAILRPTQGVSPLEEGLAKKLNRDMNMHDDPALDYIADAFVDMTPCMVPPKFLTLDEAINGVEGWKHVKSIDFKTGIGFPRCLDLFPGKLKGKQSYFTFVPKEDGTRRAIPAEDIVEDFEEITKLHQAGEEYGIIFTDQLKDETLPWRKIYDFANSKVIAKTRIMSSQPIHSFLEERVLHGWSFENMMRWRSERDDCYCELGIDPLHAGEWEMKVARKMAPDLNMDTPVIGGDAGSLDASIGRRLSQADIRCEVKLHWKYNPEMTKEREIQMLTAEKEWSEPLHLAANVLYQTIGNPSGRGRTTPKNSRCMSFVIVLTEFKKRLQVRRRISEYSKDVVIANLDLLWETVQDFLKRATTFGDDHLLRKGFVGETGYWESDMFDIRDEFALWGMEYTSCFKDQPLVSYYKLGEVKYLGRYTVVRDGVVYAPLDKDIIEDIPYFITAGGDQEYYLRETCKATLKEAFHWGREYFDMWKDRLDKALNEKGYKQTFMSFEACSAEFFRDKTQHVAQMSQKKKRYVGQMATIKEGKQEVQQQITQTIATTTFADEVGRNDPKQEITSVKMSILKNVDPYPDQPISKILSRPYPIAVFDWTTAMSTGADVYTIDFPNYLMAIPNIDDKMNRFQYLNAGILVQVRLNTTNFHQGQLMCGWAPHYNEDQDNNNTPFDNIYSLSGQPHVIVSAGTGVTSQFIIPFVGPSNFWNLKDDPLSDAMGFMGMVNFKVLAPLRLFGATTMQTVQATVYASFVESKVAGMGLRTGATDRENFKAKNKYIAQMVYENMDAQEQEQDIRSDNNSISSKERATKPSGFWDYAAQFGQGLLRALPSALINLGSKIIMTFLDKPTSTQAVQKYVKNEFTSLANASGLDGCEMLAMDPKNHVATDCSIYVEPVNYNLFANYKLLPYLYFTGSFDASTAIGTKIFILPITPTACYSQNAINEGMSGPLFYPTFLCELASHFMFWRGGIKVLFKFSASKFTTCMLRFVHLPDPTYTGSFPANQEGDVVNRTQQIIGDTSVAITVPYLREQAWQPVITPADAIPPILQWGGFNGQLVVYIVNPITNASTTGDCIIDFSVFISGAEDFEVSRPTALWQGYIDGTGLALSRKKKKYVAQMSIDDATDIRAMFRKTFDPLIPATCCVPRGISMGEEISSWPQLLKRYSLIKEYSTTNTSIPFTGVFDPWVKSPGSDTDIRNNWIRVWRSFWFVRGGYRLKLVINTYSSADPLWQTAKTLQLRITNNNNGSGEIYDDLSQLDAGAVWQIGANQMSVEAEIPFYTPYNMICDSFNIEKPNRPQAFFSVWDYSSTNIDYDLDMLISASDSTTFGWPTNPVPLWFPTVSKVNNNEKVAGGNRPRARAVNGTGNLFRQQENKNDTKMNRIVLKDNDVKKSH